MSLKRQEHYEREQDRRRRTLTIMLFLLLLILLPLCIVATYTWFSISRTPKVSDMEMTINSNAGLQIAWSASAPAEEWQQRLVYTDAVSTDTLLTPVTWSDAQHSFYTTTFGIDGRIKDVGVRLTDAMDSNGRDGHYIKFTLYGRTEEHVDVSLAPAVELEDGTAGAGTYLIGTPLWQPEEVIHDDGGKGAQYAVRVGLRCTKIRTDGSEMPPNPFLIYEPNADGHIDGSVGYDNTPSIDGTDNLVPEARIIRQSTSTWEESYPVERGVVIRDLGDFQRDPVLFELTPEERVKIEVYIWLEGMDVDCVNAIGQGARILANLQFLAEPHNQSGLVPIE